MDGLQRLLDFTNFLTESRIIHKIEQTAHDELMVSFATVGKRVEVYFTPEDVAYSIFSGDEDMLEGLDAVKRMVEEFRDS